MIDGETLKQVMKKLAQHVNDYVEEKIRQELPAAVQEVRIFSRAEVTDVSTDMTTVKVVRTDQTESDGKWYPTLSSYTPEVGDNVFLLKAGTSWLCLGELRNTKETVPDRDTVAPGRLLGDGQYTDGTKTVLTGAYPLLGQPNGLIGALLNGQNVQLNMQTLGESRRIRYYVATCRQLSDGNGATVTLPTAAISNEHVWVFATPIGGYVDGGFTYNLVPSYTVSNVGSTYSVNVKMRQFANANIQQDFSVLIIWLT